MAGTPSGATATIEARSGSKVSGTADFVPSGDKVKVTVKLEGLTPGKHGFHLHEKGDCSAPDATSAGPHWNPHGKEHGGPGAAARHAGDFGNVVAGPDGKAELSIETSDFALAGPTSVLNRAVVVHEKEDDLKSQPAGNAGARIGCGVVQAK